MTDEQAKHPGLSHLSRSSTDYTEIPQAGTLEAFDNSHPGRDYWITFDCPEFTSLCPITGQPDFGHITIRYIADKLCLESKSLKLYMFSFRNHGTFHEEVINRILDDVVATVAPRQAVVRGEFNPRGGIAIIVEAAMP